jgi:glycosyltransferase involved in cell wall biosynthesis
MITNPDIGIVCFAPDPWGIYWMSRHQIMSRLAEHYKILWVAPPLKCRQALRFPESRKLSRGVKKITQSFWTYAPERYLFKIYRLRMVERFLFSCRLRKIKSLLAAMGIKRIVLYLWRPQFGSYLGRLNAELTCYQIGDEYTFSDIDLPIPETEKRVLKNADIVFITSKTLLEKKGKLNPETYYLPNGVDFNHFRAVTQSHNPAPPEFKSIPKPRIGYVGYIKQQLNLRLLHEIAQKRKDWSVVLVGPVHRGHRSIRADYDLLHGDNNVFFLGPKKPKDLPRYINEMDVCLMNYRKTGYTRYIYPLKLHEYFSCGKPIVATCLDNLKEFGELLYFAEGLEDWIAKIQSALRESDPAIQRKRIAVAKENDWENRVDLIKSIIQTKLDRQEKYSFHPTLIDKKAKPTF